MKRALPHIAALLSALLLWAAYPPCGETCAIAFALAPLMAVARLCAPRIAAKAWFLGGSAFWVATLSWMPAITRNEGPLPLVLLGWAGLSALCAAYFALYGWLSAKAWRGFAAKGGVRAAVAAAFLEPVLWAGLEWLRGWLFTGFAWNFLGTALAPAPQLLGPARLGGPYLASAAVVMVNGVFATLACRLAAQMRPDSAAGAWGERGRWARTLETAAPLGLALFLVCAGAAAAPAGRETIGVKAALVQRNAPCIFSRRDAGERPEEAFGGLLQAASAARPDLLVWAESAMSEFGPLASARAHAAAGAFSRMAGGAALLAGGDWAWIERTEKGPERRTWNAAGLYVPAGTNMALQVYGKQHLVPFGEYVPFDKELPFLQRFSPIGVSLWPGECRVLELPVRRADGVETVKIAPLICFEDTDPELSRAAARKGAQAIVLVTNDSWFSGSHETVQHAWQAVLRAVETGLPVMRAGNSGVTGVVAPSGAARWLEDGSGKPLVDARGSMVETVAVPVSPEPTPYVRFGDGPLKAAFALALALVFARRRDGAGT